MVPAVAHLRDWVVLLTAVAADEVQVGPNLPVDLLPADSEGFSHVSDKLLQIPVPVNHVFGAHLAVGIDRLLAVVAGENLPLLLRKKFVAVGTFVKVILLFLQQKL